MMANAPPPFDPSKPFSTEGGASPPPFDPGKPFTTAPVAGAPAPQPTSPSLPRPGVGERIAGAVVPPVINFLDYPIRDVVGRAYGMMPWFGGAVPTDEASRQKFYDVRNKVMEGTAIPETDAGQAISRVLGYPGSKLGSAIQGLGERALGKSAADAIAPYAGAAMDVAALTPAARAAGSVERVATSATNPFAGVKAGGQTLADVVSEGRAGAADRWIDDMYRKAVGPSTTGRDTPLQRRNAISEIIGNKADLKYTDAEGKVTASGRLPQSLNETVEAIDQSKDKLFQQWDTLTKLAGEQGARVDIAPVVQALRQQAADPSLRRVNPAAVKRAEELADEYAKSGTLTPTEAQNDITAFNQNLKRYYKAPQAVAPVEEAAVRALRQQLDQTVEATVAPGYQALKTRYGALRAIEDDVDRAARRVGNWRAGGGIFSPVANIGSVLEIGRGIVNMNLADVAAGITLKGLAEYAKARSNPNAVIRRMFKAAEKYHKEPSVAPAVAAQTGGLQIGGGTNGIPGAQRSAPAVSAPPGGLTSPPLPSAATSPALPPQLPQSDFERAINSVSPF